MPSLPELQKKILAFRDARDWKQFHTPKDLAVSISLESAEILDHFQWKNGDTLKNYLEQSKEELGDEMADVLNYLLLLAHTLDIDLEEAFQKKLLKNEQKYPADRAKGRMDKYTAYQE